MSGRFTQGGRDARYGNRSRVQPRVSRYLALTLGPIGFGAATIGLRFLLARAPQGIHVDLAQPLPVATTWHSFGLLAVLLVFVCVLVAAVPYAWILLCTYGKAPGIGLPALLLASAVSMAIALTMPVIFSSDVYAYAAYGFLSAHGSNPYAHTLLSPHDALLRSAIWQWSNPLPVCVYGPLFVWIAKVGVIAGTPFGVAAQLLILRAMSCASLLACGALAFLAFEGFGRNERLAAVAGIILNPVIIWIAAEGHNDTLMLAIVLLGFAAIRRFGYGIGAFVMASSALIKVTGAAAAFVLAIYVWPVRTRAFQVAAGIAAGLILVGLTARPFESGVQIVLNPGGHYAPQFSAQYLLAAIVRAFGTTQSQAVESAAAIVLLSCGALALYGIRLALKAELQGAALLALALWFAIPNPYPWYALWILPVAFLCLKKPAAWAIIISSIIIFARYIPDASSSVNPDFNLALSAIEVLVPLAVLWGIPSLGSRRAVTNGL